MPSFKHGAHTGETARSWDDIVAFYAGLAEGNAAFGPLASLSARLAGSDFVGAGLCGLTSMHDLLLGPSRKVLGNPYLVVQWDFKPPQFGVEAKEIKVCSPLVVPEGPQGHFRPGCEYLRQRSVVRHAEWLPELHVSALASDLLGDGRCDRAFHVDKAGVPEKPCTTLRSLGIGVVPLDAFLFEELLPFVVPPPLSQAFECEAVPPRQGTARPAQLFSCWRDDAERLKLLRKPLADDVDEWVAAPMVVA